MKHDAYDDAVKAHAGQHRKQTGAPYIVHIDDVIENLEIFEDTELIPEITDAMLCAACLHDVVEDTMWDIRDIEIDYGNEVAVIVAFLTQSKESDRERRLLDYCQQLSKAPETAQIIKAADIMANATDIALTDDAVWKARFVKEKTEMLASLNKISNAIENNVLAKLNAIDY